MCLPWIWVLILDVTDSPTHAGGWIMMLLYTHINKPFTGA